MFNMSKVFKTKLFQANQHKVKYPYNSEGYYVVDNKLSRKRQKSKITVITPVYNAEKYLKKTIESVIHQSIGLNHIEYILVDDHSTDSTREILKDYSTKFANVVAIFLKNNSGTPGKPRNIGIQNANSPYITFLDADDWLETNSIEVLYRILEETGDDYVVGKTIQVEGKKTMTIGEHESCKERRGVSPFSIPHIFHHLGPRARMIRASVITDHHIRFPEMKFAEDKQFFIDVLIHCKSISTTKEPIYYLNRLNNAQTRLTNQTNIMHKTNCNLKVINYIQNKDIDNDKKKLILNRLYEFDSITRFFKTPHFEKTKLKRLYYNKFNQVLKTTKALTYEFSEEFLQPSNKVAYELLQTKKYNDLENLINWEKNERVKEVFIQDHLPYIVAPINEVNRNIRLPMYATIVGDSFKDNAYCLNFKVYGDHISEITDILLQKWNDAHVEYSLPVKVDAKGNGLFEIDLAQMSKFQPSTYSIFLRYNDYLKINIRKPDKNSLSHRFKDHEFILFQTKYANIGLKVVADSGA